MKPKYGRIWRKSSRQEPWKSDSVRDQREQTALEEGPSLTRIQTPEIGDNQQSGVNSVLLAWRQERWGHGWKVWGVTGQKEQQDGYGGDKPLLRPGPVVPSSTQIASPGCLVRLGQQWWHTGRKPGVWEQGQGEKVRLVTRIGSTTYVQNSYFFLSGLNFHCPK